MIKWNVKINESDHFLHITFAELFFEEQLFDIRQQWLPPGVTNCMVFNFNSNTVMQQEHSIRLIC